MKEIQEFGPNVKKLEREVVQFIQENLFIGQKNAFSTIKSYFITRKYLTQGLLERLTDFSRGTISQEINTMLTLGIIEKHRTSSTGEIIYALKSVEYAFLHGFLNSTKEINSLTEDVFRLKQEMEKEKQKLTDHEGFDEIFELLEALSRTKPLLNLLLDELEREMEKLNVE
jgi:DNA-binding transcriptional regulator GbsR (MarR family)